MKEEKGTCTLSHTNKQKDEKKQQRKIKCETKKE